MVGLSPTRPFLKKPKHQCVAGAFQLFLFSLSPPPSIWSVPPLHSPLTAPPHPKAKEGETNTAKDGGQRETDITNDRLPNLVHRPQCRYTR